MTERLILKLYKIHGYGLKGKVITVDKETLRYFTGEYGQVFWRDEGVYHFFLPTKIIKDYRYHLFIELRLT